MEIQDLKTTWKVISDPKHIEMYPQQSSNLVLHRNIGSQWSLKMPRMIASMYQKNMSTTSRRHI